jgi:SAM-dependent methyltransferase
MTNTSSWDRVGARQAPSYDTDALLYGPDGPTERDLRLLGDLREKRVLDLGCGSGQAAVALARQGAIVIGLDASEGQLARARQMADREEVKVEWRKGDLADLAFLRAESIDVAFSAFTIAEVEDVARLFRQVQRVLKPGSHFVFSYEHPIAMGLGSGEAAGRSYFDPGPVIVQRHGEPVSLYLRTIGEIFTELGRAGFRVDAIVEPEAGAIDGRLPSTIVWRARKEGA